MARTIPSSRLTPPGLPSRGQFRSLFPLTSALLLTALLFLLPGCTLRPEARGSTGDATKNPPSKIADYTTFQAVGKVKADEFNDEATGEDVPTLGGQLVEAFSAEPHNLNFWLESTAASQEIDQYIYDSLLRQNPETFKFEGSLAQRWTEEDIVIKKDGSKIRGVSSYSGSGPIPDLTIKTSSGELHIPATEIQAVRKGAVFTFYLRHGVKFHDGVPLTAADVKFSFDTIKNEYVDAPAQRAYDNDLESCEVLDDYTVRLTYAKQFFQARAVAGGFSVLPKHIYDPDNLLERDPKAFGTRFNQSDENRRPIGTGPYKFERWDTGIQIVLTRNDNYFDPAHRGHLDHLIFKIITDLVAQMQALKNGDVDFMPATTAEDWEQENSPEFLKRFAKVQYYTPNLGLIAWNMRRPPFNDARVRLAMAYGAFDREQFLQTADRGRGVVVTGDQYYFGPAYDHSIKPYPYDPEKAKQLLLEAGWYDRTGKGIRENKDGQQFRFEMLLPNGAEMPMRRAAIIQENLRRLGIDMTVRELEWATFIENINDRQFDAAEIGWEMDLESDPYQLWDTSQSNNGGSNISGFGNAETDRLIAEERGTLDDDARHALLFKLQEIIHEQQPCLFLYTAPSLGFYNRRYRGVKFYKGQQSYDLSEWYIPRGSAS